MNVLSCMRIKFLDKGTLSLRKLINNNKIIKRELRSRRAMEEGGMNLAPGTLLETPRQDRMLPGLLKSFVFASAFTGVLFAGAAIWQYENTTQWKTRSGSDWIQSKWNKMEGWKHKEGDLRKVLNRWWNGLHEGTQVFWVICGANVLVFAGWRHPALQRIMYNFFCSSPALKAVCWPMLLSTFSHHSPIHLAMNMFVFHSFCAGVCGVLTKEQFVAFYLSGGIISSLSSHVLKVAKNIIGPSLGASGAIMAVLGFFCTTNPDASLGIVFLPGLAFSAATAIKCIIALDVAGVLFGWRLFDHAAHLGGAIFGVLYAHYGHEYVWSKQKVFVEKWKEMKKKSGT